MKKKRIITVRTLLSGVLAMLGFAGCANSADAPCEYGMPSVDYRVTGEVKDESGKPLPGIQVIVKDEALLGKEGAKPYQRYEGDTIYTDSKGVFQSAKITSFSLKEQEVIFNDVDGKENGGEFESARMSIDDLESKRIKKGDGWHSGEYELKAKVQLKKK